MWSQLQMFTVAAGERLARRGAADRRCGPRPAACAGRPGRGRRRRPARCDRRRSRSRRSRGSGHAVHSGRLQPVRAVTCRCDLSSCRYFADLTGPQVAERLTERSILVQPLGAIEQHGPHLPLSTDSVVATAVAEAAVAAGRRRARRVAAADAGVHEVERARLVGGHGLAVGHHAAGGARRHRPLRRHHPGEAARVPQRSRRQQRAAQRGQPRAAARPRADDVPRPPRRAARSGWHVAGRASWAWASTAAPTRRR